MVFTNSMRVLLAVGGIALAGCATIEKSKPIAAGDQVGVEFTCRLSNGDIVVTTSSEITNNAALHKSDIFLARDSWDTLMLTAGGSAAGEANEEDLLFEDRISASIAAALVGMTEGERRTVQLKAERKERDSRGDVNSTKIDRVIHRPIEMEMAAGEFSARSGEAPKEGKEIDLGEGVRAKVISVNGESVQLKVSASADASIRTPFGQGKVTETAQDLEISIDAQVGRLVRSGPLVGRIAAADDTSITLDFAHPFGGEELTCDLMTIPAAKIAKQGDVDAKK